MLWIAFIGLSPPEYLDTEELFSHVELLLYYSLSSASVALPESAVVLEFIELGFSYHLMIKKKFSLTIPKDSCILILHELSTGIFAQKNRLELEK